MRLSRASRKGLSVFVLLLVIVTAGFGDEELVSWSFASETGLTFVYGEAKEIVYKTSSGTDLLSLLVYPVPPSLGAYVGMEGRWRDTLLARIRLETAWPLSRGNLTDEDWSYGNLSTNEPNVRSDSTAYLTSWLHGELELGFPDKKYPATVETLLGLSFRQMSWEGWDALQIPPPDDYPTGNIYGYVIDYRQTWLIPWIGLSIGQHNPASVLVATFKFSPWMYVVGRDVHMARPKPLTFIDVMNGGVMFSGALRSEIRLVGKLWLAGEISLDYISGARGDTYTYELGSSIPVAYKNMSGAALTLFSSYLGFAIHP